jgi:hypothetical protein
MAQSDLLSLWNNALGFIGAGTSIAAVTEQSAEAAACALAYRQVVEEILRETDWNCVRRRAALDEVPEGAVWPPLWGYMFLWPADCLKVRGFDTGLPTQNGGWAQVAYEVGNDATAGRVIYMNLADPVIVYTAYEYDPDDAPCEARFDSSLRQAVSWSLAATIAGRLTGSAQVVQQTRAMALQALAQAREANANESAPNSMDVPEPESIAVRGYDGCWPHGGRSWR